MHGPINVKSHNNITNWQMRFNSAFKGLINSMLSSFVPDKFRNRILSEIRPLSLTYKNGYMQYSLVILLKNSNSTSIVQSFLVTVYTRASQNVSRHANEFENCFHVWWEKFDQPKDDSGFNKENISCMLINILCIKNLGIPIKVFYIITSFFKCDANVDFSIPSVQETLYSLDYWRRGYQNSPKPSQLFTVQNFVLYQRTKIFISVDLINWKLENPL
jgi:hypothetical protein